MAWDVNTSTADATITILPASGQRSYRSALAAIGNITVASARAYFVYLGKTTRQVDLVRIGYFVATVADTGSPAEVGYFSTPLAPCRASQTLTKIAATAALGLTALKTQSTPLATSIPAGTHLWVGFRDASATTRVTLRGLGYDMLDGSCLITSSATALTSGTTYTGTIPTDGTTATCPDIFAALD